MKLLDTNVINYALTPGSPWGQWARQVIAEAVSEGGAAVNPVVLAEIVTWMVPGSDAEAALKSFGVGLVDLPAQAGPICGAAYRDHLKARKAESGKDGPRMPLPDFFIGAHAAVLGIPLITNHPGRFKTYFPKVELVTPSN
jgi:predicted nucleic acid-binding protein